MELVLRAAAVYLALLVLLRASGRRTLAQSSTFDLALLLIISEGVQQALLGPMDSSFTGAMIIVVTLVALDVGVSLVKRSWPAMGRIIAGEPIVLVENGKLLDQRMHYARVELSDIMVEARAHGVVDVEEIRFAVLETSGRVSVIPKANAGVPSSKAE